MQFCQVRPKLHGRSGELQFVQKIHPLGHVHKSSVTVLDASSSRLAHSYHRCFLAIMSVRKFQSCSVNQFWTALKRQPYTKASELYVKANEYFVNMIIVKSLWQRKLCLIVKLQTPCGSARWWVDVRGSSGKAPINFGTDTTWWLWFKIPFL